MTNSRRSSFLLSLLVAFTAISAGAEYGAVKPFRDCRDCPEMVVIPAGAFAMGGGAAEHVREHIPAEMAAKEGPVHRVVIAKAMAVSRYEITRGEFALFVATRATDTEQGGCTVLDAATGKWNIELARSWRDPGFVQSDRHPVVCVNWNDAQAYVAWLSAKTQHHYRLLSESEWEYAARASSLTTRFWGEGRDDACQHASVADLTRAEAQHVPMPTSELVFQCRDGFVQTAPVGSFPPNAFGLFDMNGNVWEWTADCLNADYADAPSDGSARTTGDCSKHMDRGGSWVNSPKYLRSAVRHADVAAIRNDVLGLRIARDMDRVADVDFTP